MVIFHKFEIRTKPGIPALTLYAPDRENLKQDAQYQALIETNHPRSIQLTDYPYWYHNGEETRNATPEEIKEWIKNEEISDRPGMETLSPARYYQYFGDTAVLDTLKQKLDAEYADCRKAWESAYQEGTETLYEKLSEVCIVNTVYRNLLSCGDAYAKEYMAALAEEENPLRLLCGFYEQAGRFAIEPEIREILADLGNRKEELSQWGAMDRESADIQEHEALMERLDSRLDQQYQDWLKEAPSDFEGILNEAIEIHTGRQLYQSLRFEKEQYPAELLDLMAQVAEPMKIEWNWLVGERVLCEMTLDEINDILPRMYPEIVPEASPWDSRVKPEDTCSLAPVSFESQELETAAADAEDQICGPIL